MFGKVNDVRYKQYEYTTMQHNTRKSTAADMVYKNYMEVVYKYWTLNNIY